MTAQIMEILIIDEKQYPMASEPLELYLRGLHEKPPLIVQTTACWRGYHGTWSLIDKKLYLIGLEGIIKIKDERIDFQLDNLFPERVQVFAEWFSGVIRVPEGEMLEYIHAGYGSIYENDLFLKFNNGVLTDFRTENTIEKMVNSMQTPMPKKTQNLWHRIWHLIFK